MAINITPEQQAKIDLVRILVGDSPGSIFYPVLSDEQYYAILELENWDVKKAARRIAVSISLVLSQVSYRERTDDIEVWNNASIEYRKSLENLLDDKGSINLPESLKPYAAGISREDICDQIMNPDLYRSPLAQISPCAAWWTRIENRGCCPNGTSLVNNN